MADHRVLTVSAASVGPAQHYLQPSGPPPAAFDQPPDPAPRGQPRVQFGDYNPRPKAWQPGGGDSYSCPASMSTSWNSSDFDSYHHNGYGGALYSPDDLPACDL